MVGLTFAESLEENGLVHFPKTPLEEIYNCVTLSKKSQLCHKHNCENNSCVVYVYVSMHMVCESMIHPLRLARGNFLRREIGERSENCVLFKVLQRLQHVGISNEWRDKPELPSEVSHRAGKEKIKS